VTLQRLPVRVAPVHGEAIDSWLEAIASNMDLPFGVLARALGLPSAVRPRWLVRLSRAQLHALEMATGVSSKVIEGMTVSAFDDAALEVDLETDELDETFVFGPLSWSRFCPECLSASHGRWQLRWRLGWSFACTVHKSLLVDVCPSCGERQRRCQIYRRVPEPMLCRCGCSLASASATRLPADDEIIVAQRAIFDLITESDLTFGVFGPRRIHSRVLLEAIRSLANRVLNYASIHGLMAVTSVRLVPWLGEDALAAMPLVQRSALNTKAPSRAIDTAVGITAALTILVAPTIERAGARARWLVDGQNRHPDSDILLDDITVSRRHAEFGREKGQFRVLDVGSLNGAYVNRQPVELAVLQSGDEIQIGKFRLVFLTKPATS
jgi:hypothetical protein